MKIEFEEPVQIHKGKFYCLKVINKTKGEEFLFYKGTKIDGES